MTAPRTRRALAHPVVALLVFGVAWLAATPGAHAVHNVTITTPVTDLAGVLTPAEEERVAARLVAYREATGVQLAVVIVDSTDAPIDDWTNRVFRAWGGGSKERNDGALFVLAIDDRANRLEVGYGLEGHISDGMALDMLVDLRPLLREARYADASIQLIDAVWAATDDITPAAPIGAPLSRSPWFYLGMMLVALAGGATWLARLDAASRRAAHAKRQAKQQKKKKKKKGFAAVVPDLPGVEEAAVRASAQRLRTIFETLALFVVAPVLVMILAHPGMGAPFAWFVAWMCWVLIGLIGVALWQHMPIGRWFWLIPSAAGVGALVYALFQGAGAPDPAVAHATGNLITLPEEVYGYALVALATTGFWAGLVAGAGAPSSGGSSSGSSYRSSSSSYSSSSSSSWSSSSSSSSSWSGGGGSSGGGGASSSW